MTHYPSGIMKKLPLLLSVPHAGLQIPAEVQQINLLSPKDIIEDGDEGAAQIYAPLQKHVQHYVSTDIARAFVDQNRAEDDFRKDGIVKTHTCWDVPIYQQALTKAIIQQLISRYHRPYHHQLSTLATNNVILAIDCHTMADYGPPVAPDPGMKRPLICLGNVHGKTCPAEWLDKLADCFARQFGDHNIAVNKPFAGGYITQTHGREIPWVQLELSRTPSLSNQDKSAKVLAALQCWCQGLNT